MKNRNILVISIILNVILLGLILHIRLKPNPSYDTIQKLELENKTLLIGVDSLKKVNIDLNRDNLVIREKLDKVEFDLMVNNKKIKDLKNGKDKIPSFVNNLSANGITRELTEYLNRKTK